MSHEPDSQDAMPHEPRHPVPLAVEGFGADEAGHDIFFSAVQSTRMPMVVADPRLPDVPIVFVNHAFLEMTGYERDEVIGRNCRFLQGLDTDRHAVALIGEAVRSEREITIELLNYRKDGSSFWNALFLTPIRNAKDELIYFFSSQLDISRRKDAETALRQAHKMEALGQLTGGMAHDFNNLLQVILGNVDVARILTRGSEDKGLSRSLENIREAARKSGDITQKLLAFARQQRLNGRVICLDDHVGRWVQAAREALGPDLQVAIEIPGRSANIRVDPGQAEAALLALLANARDASGEDDAITVRVENVEMDAAGAIAAGLGQPGRFVSLTVEDRGAGIDPSLLGRVMDPFFTTKKDQQAPGLGLSMVYGFAKQSGGAVSIRSDVGVGTQVSLHFPVTQETPHAPAAGLRKAPAGSVRILVVDDIADVAEMAAMILTHHGFQCTQRQSADEALAALDGDPTIQILLTDIVMPGSMNGVLLAREAQRRRPELRVLLMTGFADGTIERWGGESYELISKPFTADELVSRATALLA